MPSARYAEHLTSLCAKGAILHYAARHNFTAACRNFTFEEHPDYKRKFDTAEIKLPLTITNCWIDLPEEKEDAKKFRKSFLASSFSMKSVPFGTNESLLRNVKYV